MLLKLFKSNHPYVIFLVPLVGFVLWIPALFGAPNSIYSVNTDSTTFVFNWVYGLLSFYPKSAVIFALILVIIQSYMLIRLNFKYVFIDNRTYLPAVLFLVFASTLSSYQMLHPLLIGNLFVLLAIDKAFLLDKNKNHFKRYYESGLFLGLGALFYPNIYVFTFIIWLTMVILRTFNWREWFSSVLGIITPFVFYIAILFLTDQHGEVFQKLFTVFIAPTKPLLFSGYSLIALTFIGFIILISMLVGIGVVGVKKISIRKYYSLFIWFLFFIIAIVFIHPFLGYELIIPLSIPLSIICTVFFIELRSKWVSEVLFILTLLSVFVIIWMQ